jgi:cell wall-associated NlpC family hydrolase
MIKNKTKLIVLLLLCCISFYSQKRDTIIKVKDDTLIGFAKTFLGKKYKYASVNPKVGFDCSGFVYYVFKSFNINVPRASMDYEKAGKTILLDSTRVGDVIVFTGTNAKIRKPGHVAIVISKVGEEIKFIHASSNTKRGGVIISSFKESPYYEKRFIKVVRLDCVILDLKNDLSR